MASSRLERIGTIFTRKAQIENLMDGLTGLVKQTEVDYNAMKENEQKLQHLTVSYMKCMQQSTTAVKNNLKTLKEICTTFRKTFDEFESDEKAKAFDELDNDIKQLQDKLTAESKRKSFDLLRQCYYMMNKD